MGYLILVFPLFLENMGYSFTVYILHNLYKIDVGFKSLSLGKLIAVLLSCKSSAIAW